MKMGELFSALLCSKKDSRKLSTCIIDKERLYVRRWNKKSEFVAETQFPFKMFKTIQSKNLILEVCTIQ